jgi:hypothetical protein
VIEGLSNRHRRMRANIADCNCYTVHAPCTCTCTTATDVQNRDTRDDRFSNTYRPRSPRPRSRSPRMDSYRAARSPPRRSSPPPRRRSPPRAETTTGGHDRAHPHAATSRPAESTTGTTALDRLGEKGTTRTPARRDRATGHLHPEPEKPHLPEVEGCVRLCVRIVMMSRALA